MYDWAGVLRLADAAVSGGSGLAGAKAAAGAMLGDHGKAGL